MSKTTAFRKGEDFETVNLDRFLKENFHNGVGAELEVTQFTDGYSNLTYALKMGEWRGVLRRAPLGKVAPKAHDMKREFTILKEMNQYFPLAPHPFLYCDDETIVGKPFILMELKEGISIEKRNKELEISEDEAQRISHLFIDTLIDIHSIPYEKTELQKIGKVDGFLARQVAGWCERFEKAKTREYDNAAQLFDWLKVNIPKSTYTSVIHNDYKLGNMLFSNDLAHVNGVVDWEMATIGDPLFDLGVAMSYWVEGDDSEQLKEVYGLDIITTCAGFLKKEEMIQLYAAKTGRDVTGFDFYLAFAYFKLAVICAQIYKRYVVGQTSDKRFKDFDRFIETLITVAWKTAKGGIK